MDLDIDLEAAETKTLVLMHATLSSLADASEARAVKALEGIEGLQREAAARRADAARCRERLQSVAGVLVSRGLGGALLGEAVSRIDGAVERALPSEYTGPRDARADSLPRAPALERPAATRAPIELGRPPAEPPFVPAVAPGAAPAPPVAAPAVTAAPADYPSDDAWDGGEALGAVADDGLFEAAPAPPIQRPAQRPALAAQAAALQPAAAPRPVQAAPLARPPLVRHADDESLSLGGRAASAPEPVPAAAQRRPSPEPVPAADGFGGPHPYGAADDDVAPPSQSLFVLGGSLADTLGGRKTAPPAPSRPYAAPSAVDGPLDPSEDDEDDGFTPGRSQVQRRR